jgi:hypothetical protein
MPTSFTTQRSILRNIIVGGSLQATLAETMADALLTYRMRPETSGFFQIALEKESDLAYAGKGTSFATESRLIAQSSSGEINSRLDDYLAGWFLAMVMGSESITPLSTPVLASLAGTLTVLNAGDLLSGTLSGVEGDGVTPYSIALGTPGATDTLAHLLHAINVTYASYGITATLSGPGTSMTFAATNGDAGAPTIVGSNLADLAAAGPYAHILTWMDTGAPAQVTNIYGEDAPGLKRKFQDMSCTKVVLSGTDKGSVMAKASFIGTGRYADGAMVALPALPTVQYLYGSDATISMGPAGEAVSMSPRILSWEATFDHANDLFRSCGGGIYPVFPRYGNPKVALKLVIAIDTTSDVRDWMMEQTLLDVNIAIASGAASLTIDYPNVIIPKADLGEQDKYVIYTVELDEQSILKPTGGQVCTATVVNNAPRYLTAA